MACGTCRARKVKVGQRPFRVVKMMMTTEGGEGLSLLTTYDRQCDGCSPCSNCVRELLGDSL